ncbi:hypothetical protein EYF80_041851 [Liparis tanakae]|uniref:Uncharacterized protein n=1 Tax=Liparis tanakae TaxID=230148 RepID=A0A4Z2G349_9TELE|nr:hypothetical protein EYF80_041851 [Liparis tanakae]
MLTSSPGPASAFWGSVVKPVTQPDRDKAEYGICSSYQISFNYFTLTEHFQDRWRARDFNVIGQL